MPIWPLQKDCNTFYGNPGNTPAQWDSWEKANLVDVKCPWPLFFIDGKIKQNVAAIRIHKKCADSLSSVLGQVWEVLGKDPSKISDLHYDRYSGSYNQRSMRGMSQRSMHGFGAAIDWDAEENEQHATKHLFTDDSPLIVKFKADGWTWGGNWSVGSIDSMHVQAARVR